MREIKFRAWNKLAHKMATITMLDWMLDGYRATAGKFSGSGHLADIELMQFTGLKDKNGKEIYEGDIILTGDAKWTVAWHRHEDSMIGWMVRDNKLRHWYIIDESILAGEVIGNIYEKPKVKT